MNSPTLYAKVLPASLPPLGGSSDELCEIQIAFIPALLGGLNSLRSPTFYPPTAGDIGVYLDRLGAQMEGLLMGIGTDLVNLETMLLARLDRYLGGITFGAVYYRPNGRLEYDPPIEPTPPVYMPANSDGLIPATYRQLNRLSFAIGGGGDGAALPLDNLLIALRGDVPASPTRNVIDALGGAGFSEEEQEQILQILLQIGAAVV